MSIAVKVPPLGESVVEGTVAQWLVQEGDFVEADQIVVELTTDKVDVEIPSPSRGVIEKILVAVDENVEVGADLAIIDPDATEARAAGGQPSVSSPAPGREPRVSSPAPGREPRVSSPAPEAGSAPAAESQPAAAPVHAAASGTAGSPGTAKATPVARRIAEDARVDLEAVQGTGSAGRITKEDVLRHSESPPSAAPVPVAAAAPGAPARQPAPVREPSVSSPAPAAARPPAKAPATPGYALQPGDRVIPMSRLRKLVADHMVYSKRTSPHVGTVAEVDMSEVVKLRSRNKSSFQENHGVGLTFLPFIVHAVVRALRETPALNASVIEDAIVEKQAINIGIAVETEKGLVVPVVRNADRFSIAGLAAAIDELSNRARSKKLSADELQGGTFTISNPGRKGNLYGFAIINQPQVGILRLGEMVKRPVVRSTGGEDAIVIRSMMHLALSYDHRAVDGQPANAFLYRIRELLEAAEFDL